MKYYSKKWPQNTATVFNARGEVVWTFTSVEEAARECIENNQSLEESEQADINIAV